MVTTGQTPRASRMLPQLGRERLIAAVLDKQRKGQDNVTVVALAYGESAPVPLPQASMLEETQVRDRAKESLAAREMAARATVEARLATAPPPRKARMPSPSGDGLKKPSSPWTTARSIRSTMVC